MSSLFWFLAAVVGWLAAILAILLRRRRSEGERAARYVRRLEETHGYLQDHITRLETLTAMLSDLYKLGMAAEGRDNKRIYDLIVLDACRLLQTKTASLMRVEPDGQTLRIVASIGLAPEAAEQTLRVGEGIAGRVAETGEAICVEDLRTDRRFLREPLSTLESAPVASVALHVKDRGVGVLTVNAQPPRVFEEREVRLLGVLADQAAITLENLRLYENTRKVNLDLVQTLLRALNAKESADSTPSRAHAYARGVARELNLPEDMAQFVEYAAMMRGIGKSGIGESILKKPGKLTAEEYALVKRHPAIGSQILSPMSFLAPAAPMVLYHQEWFNGQGYPDGLSGEEIPLGARIVSVVSAWEAMTSDRPYRPAMAREVAERELRKGAGTQFDPKVVDAFLRFLEREEPRRAAPAAV